MIYFETPRLLLRDWTEQDSKAFRIMNADSRVMEYYPKALTEEESDNFCSLIQDELKDRGYGLYAVETKHDHAFIGYIGFHYTDFPADFTPCVEIGWRLKYDAWGKGYATEGAAVCLSYGFKMLSFTRVYSFTAKTNTRSENVMKKIGMVKIADFDHPKLAEGSLLGKHVLYAATAASV